MQTEQSTALFDNLRGMLTPAVFSRKTGFSRKTIYNWKYYSKVSENIPSDLFVKFRGKLYIRTDVFKTWMSSNNPNLVWDQFE